MFLASALAVVFRGEPPFPLRCRCYQKSTDGASGSTFHSKCNNYKNTIVVIRNSFGKVFGGTNVNRSVELTRRRVCRAHAGLLLLLL